MISLSYPFFNSLEINFQTQSPSLVGSVNIAGTTAEIILRIHAVHVCPQRYVVGRTEHSHAVKADAAGQGLRQCIGKGDVLHAEIRRVDQVTVENNRLGVDLCAWYIGEIAGRAPSAEAVLMYRRSEERRVGKECRSRWSPYH